MDAISKVNTYFPSTTWTSFTVLANLVVNNATMCASAQEIVLWVLIALFCIFNFTLCFTDSVTLPAPPGPESQGKTVSYTVILLPGWFLPVRIYRRIKKKQARHAHLRAHRHNPGRTLDTNGSRDGHCTAGGGSDCGKEGCNADHLEEGCALVSKVIFLPDIPEGDPNRCEVVRRFETGDKRLSFQDVMQAVLTTGTFLTLAILNTAYVACVFPAYDPGDVIYRGQALAPGAGGMPRKLLSVEGDLPTRVDPTIIRAVPTIVAFFVSGLLSFFKAPRHMVGYVPANASIAQGLNPALKPANEAPPKDKSPGDLPPAPPTSRPPGPGGPSPFGPPSPSLPGPKLPDDGNHGTGPPSRGGTPGGAPSAPAAGAGGTGPPSSGAGAGGEIGVARPIPPATHDAGGPGPPGQGGGSGVAPPPNTPSGPDQASGASVPALPSNPARALVVEHLPNLTPGTSQTGPNQGGSGEGVLGQGNSRQMGPGHESNSPGQPSQESRSQGGLHQESSSGNGNQGDPTLGIGPPPDALDAVNPTAVGLKPSPSPDAPDTSAPAQPELSPSAAVAPSSNPVSGPQPTNSPPPRSMSVKQTDAALVEPAVSLSRPQSSAVPPPATAAPSPAQISLPSVSPFADAPAVEGANRPLSASADPRESHPSSASAGPGAAQGSAAPAVPVHDSGQASNPILFASADPRAGQGSTPPAGAFGVPEAAQESIPPASASADPRPAAGAPGEEVPVQASSTANPSGSAGALTAAGSASLNPGMGSAHQQATWHNPDNAAPLSYGGYTLTPKALGGIELVPNGSGLQTVYSVGSHPAQARPHP